MTPGIEMVLELLEQTLQELIDSELEQVLQ